MTPRAAPMSAEERREALVAATLPLLREHGRSVTTRQIAEAACVAEGTIFRVFESKEELVDAAIARAFEPGTFAAQVEAIDRDQPLRARLVDLTTLTQVRLRATFGLIQRVGMVGPPPHLHDSDRADAWRATLTALVVDLVGDDARELDVPADHLCHVLRLLTFSGTHEQVADGRTLTPEQIVDVVLDGCRARPEPRTPRC